MQGASQSSDLRTLLDRRSARRYSRGRDPDSTRGQTFSKRPRARASRADWRTATALDDLVDPNPTSLISRGGALSHVALRGRTSSAVGRSLRHLPLVGAWQGGACRASSRLTPHAFALVLRFPHCGAGLFCRQFGCSAQAGRGTFRGMDSVFRAHRRNVPHGRTLGRVDFSQRIAVRTARTLEHGFSGKPYADAPAATGLASEYSCQPRLHGPPLAVVDLYDGSGREIPVEQRWRLFDQSRARSSVHPRAFRMALCAVARDQQHALLPHGLTLIPACHPEA